MPELVTSLLSLLFQRFLFLITVPELVTCDGVGGSNHSSVGSNQLGGWEEGGSNHSSVGRTTWQCSCLDLEIL